MSRFLTSRKRVPSGMLRTPEELKQDEKFPAFGKYTNGRNPKTWNEIAEINPQYIVWAFESVKNRQLCSRPLAEFCGVRFAGAPDLGEDEDEQIDHLADDVKDDRIMDDDIPF